MADVTSYRSALLSLPGATERVAPAGPEATGNTALDALDAQGVAWHYGDPLGEQRALERSPRAIDRSQRGVIAVSGPEAGQFLNNLLSQKLDDAEDGFSASALDLDIQGHVLHHADVVRAGDIFYLDVPAAQQESLLSFLQKMVFWSQVTIELTDLGVVTILGPSTQEISGLEGVVATRRVPWPAAPRIDLLVPRAQLSDVFADLKQRGIAPAGLMAFTAERVRALEPELAIDLDNKSIAHEAHLFIGRGDHLGAVHLNKGCYRGQETVARVENLGRSPRLLVLLLLDGSSPQEPSPGEPITVGARAVGRIGTVVHDYDLGPIALGLVKRSALNSAQLHVGETAVAVDKDRLPQDEGAKAGRAAVEKLRSQR
ncbi:YgfZ/GcvT domain-containing protein [Corynebacterium tapiri]|uniref:Folate-binding protein YgfZ n=1 Tax=Corynebacterium tapiri TaxID=1448266 RepID=A0A5C4U455_9CORY|nr:folate-binding protein YgfZ [Corynebacterium tapiri]TNL96105.1 folate-binding protein YgfZ [Corynebacterium tapiri]